MENSDVMKVSELIKMLEEFPDDAEVYLSKDPEGNEYRSPKGPFQMETDDDRLTNVVVIFPTDFLYEMYEEDGEMFKVN